MSTLARRMIEVRTGLLVESIKVTTMEIYVAFLDRLIPNLRVVSWVVVALIALSLMKPAARLVGNGIDQAFAITPEVQAVMAEQEKSDILVARTDAYGRVHFFDRGREVTDREEIRARSKRLLVER